MLTLMPINSTERESGSARLGSLPPRKHLRFTGPAPTAGRTSCISTTGTRRAIPTRISPRPLPYGSRRDSTGGSDTEDGRRCRNSSMWTNSCVRWPANRRSISPLIAIADYDCLNVKLKTYYARKRKLYADSFPDFYDNDLRQLFPAAADATGRVKASVYLRQNRRPLMEAVCRWTNEKQYRVSQLLTRLIDRCNQLGLYLSAPRSKAKRATLRLHHDSGDEPPVHRQFKRTK